MVGNDIHTETTMSGRNRYPKQPYKFVALILATVMTSHFNVSVTAAMA